MFEIIIPTDDLKEHEALCKQLNDLDIEYTTKQLPTPKFNTIGEIERIIIYAPGSWKNTLSHGEQVLIDTLGFAAYAFDNVFAYNIYLSVYKMLDSCLERGYSDMLNYHGWDE